MRFLEVCDSKNTFHNPRLFQAFLKMFWLGKKKKITWKIKILASFAKLGATSSLGAVGTVDGLWSVSWTVQLCVTPWTAACQASLSITNFRSILKLMSIESVMTSTHLILCCPLLLLPSIFLRIRVFPNESVLCIRWPKY